MCTSRCQQILSPESYVSCVFCYECSFFLIQTPAFLLGLLPVPLFLALFLSFRPQSGEQPIGNVRARWAAPCGPLCTGLAGGSECWAGLRMRHRGTLVLCQETSSRLYISYLVTEWHPGPASSSLSTVSALCLLGAHTRTARTADAGPVLADALRKFLFDLDVDDGLAAVGYSKADIPALVKGTLPQVRDTAHLHSLLETQSYRKDVLHLGRVRGDENPGSTGLLYQMAALPSPGGRSHGSLTFIFFHKTVWHVWNLWCNWKQPL